jgi:hypothetical protein
LAKIPHLHEIAQGIEGRSMPQRIADFFEPLDQDGEQIGERLFFAGEGTTQGIESFEFGECPLVFGFGPDDAGPGLGEKFAVDGFG